MYVYNNFKVTEWYSVSALRWLGDRSVKQSCSSISPKILWNTYGEPA